jgi:hypothetical protein
MCYTYIDGILSNAVFYDKKDEFKDLDNYFAHLKINTNAASVRIYGIRFYNESFSPRKVLNNYIATLPTWDERSMAYYQNEVYSGTGDVDLEKITSEEYKNL